MASNYGAHFGFRKSDESVRRSNGDYLAPLAGDLRHGMVVNVQAGTAFLKVASSAAGQPGRVGLLLQELSHIPSVFRTQVADSSQLEKVTNGQQALLVYGAGVEIWVKNLPARKFGTTDIPAVTMITEGLAAETLVGWDGSKFVAAATAADAIAVVTESRAGYAELQLIK